MSPSVAFKVVHRICIFPYGKVIGPQFICFSFFFLFFFFFLIVELIQPILWYNKKIITEKREKHAFFFWCLVKVGKNMSIWHGNYSSSPFISHASWGNDGSCRKKCPARFLDLDQWLKATLKWDLMKVSVDQYTAYFIQTCSKKLYTKTCSKSTAL